MILPLYISKTTITRLHASLYAQKHGKIRVQKPWYMFKKIISVSVIGHAFVRSQNSEKKQKCGYSVRIKYVFTTYFVFSSNRTNPEQFELFFVSLGKCFGIDRACRTVTCSRARSATGAKVA